MPHLAQLTDGARDDECQGWTLQPERGRMLKHTSSRRSNVMRRPDPHAGLAERCAVGHGCVLRPASWRGRARGRKS